MSSPASGASAGGQHLDEAVEQVAGAEPLRGRHRDRIAEPEGVELRRERDVGDAVALVGGHEHGRVRRRSRSAISCSPGRAPARTSTTSSASVGVGEAGLRLLADRPGERVVVGEVDAAGVDQRERAPVPLALELLAVARDPRPLVHDRLARARQAVDERGLADVGVADDRDLQLALGRRDAHAAPAVRARRTSATTRSTTAAASRPLLSSPTPAPFNITALKASFT